MDEDDVENETNSPEMEVSKIRRKIWANENDKSTSMTSIMTVSLVDHESMRIRGRGMMTMTVNRTDHRIMR